MQAAIGTFTLLLFDLYIVTIIADLVLTVARVEVTLNLSQNPITLFASIVIQIRTLRLLGAFNYLFWSGVAQFLLVDLLAIVLLGVWQFLDVLLFPRVTWLFGGLVIVVMALILLILCVIIAQIWIGAAGSILMLLLLFVVVVLLSSIPTHFMWIFNGSRAWVVILKVIIFTIVVHICVSLVLLIGVQWLLASFMVGCLSFVVLISVVIIMIWCTRLPVALRIIIWICALFWFWVPAIWLVFIFLVGVITWIIIWVRISIIVALVALAIGVCLVLVSEVILEIIVVSCI